MLKIATCTIIKDEQMYLKEWIDYNISIGVSKIFLYEDSNSKSHKDICDEYKGIVELHSIFEIDLMWEGKPANHQWALYHWFVSEDNPYKKDLDWCAFIDIDEFIKFENGYTLEKICNEFNNENAIYIYWKLYGADRRWSRPAKVNEMYKNVKELPKQERAWCYKSIVNMNKENIKMKNIHHVAKGGVNAMGVRTACLKQYNKIWIDHYYTKSWEDWVYRCTERGGVLPFHRKLKQFFDINDDMDMNAVKEQMLWLEMASLENPNKMCSVYIENDLWCVLISKDFNKKLLELCKRDYAKDEEISKIEMFDKEIITKDTDNVNLADISFAVYYDPIKRFKLFWKYCVLDKEINSSFVQLFKCGDLDDALVLLKIMFDKQKIQWQDDKLRKQSDYYNVNNVDYIVKEEDLSLFLLQYGVIYDNSDEYNVDDVFLTEKQEQKLRELYASDFEILKNKKIFSVR